MNMNIISICYYSLKGLISEVWFGTIRFFRNLWKYRYILLEDQDWDYGYLDEIMLTKLRFMANYFKTSKIVEDAPKIYAEINLAIKLCNIVMEKETEIYYKGYVNLNNYQRFLPRKIKFNLDPIIYSTELRRQKAINCLFLLLRYKKESWWD